MSCSGCCCYCFRKPRYKRLVDALYPEDPQNEDPVTQDMDKLLYLARSQPDRLDEVGTYLAYKLRRSLTRDRRGHVCVSLKVMEKLLSEVSAQRLQLLAESYLDMIHELLQSNTHFFQNMAANSFVGFTEHEEENPPYHRQYEFCVERFVAMSLLKEASNEQQYMESRAAGLRGLRGVVRKVGPERSVLWESNHLNMIIPALLINMQSHTTPPDLTVEDSRSEIATLAESGFKDIIMTGSSSRAGALLEPVLQHFDISHIWEEDCSFAVRIFVLIIQVMQPQSQYLVIQALLAHVERKAGEKATIKQNMLEVLSQCVGVAADSSIGPSVLDVFKTLVKQLRNSIYDSAISEEDEGFRTTVVQMVGQFAAVIADYHNPDVMNLIFSYIPHEADGSITPFTDSQTQIQLVGILVKCLLAVSESAKPSQMDVALVSDTLLTSLSMLLSITQPAIQHDVLLLWHKMVDHHDNKQKLPLHVNWETLGECALVLGKTSTHFLLKCRKILFPKLLAMSAVLSLENGEAFYVLLCLLALEFGSGGLAETALFAAELQDIATSHSQIGRSHRNYLHGCVTGLHHLLSVISENNDLQDHVAEVITSRIKTHPHLVLDKILGKGEAPVGGEEEEEAELMQFLLRDKGFIPHTPELMRNSSLYRDYSQSSISDNTPPKPFRSHSLDHADDKDASDITFNNLKEDCLDQSMGMESGTVDELQVSDNNLTPSFEEMLGRVSQTTSLRDDVQDIINSTSPNTKHQSAYDIKTPSFH